MVEVFSACMTSTWLPPEVMARLGVKHAHLGRNLGTARRLVDPKRGVVVRGCARWPNDPDILIHPVERLAERAARIIRRGGG